MKRLIAAALVVCAASPASGLELTFSAIKVNGVAIPASRVLTDLGGREHASRMLHGSTSTGTDATKVEKVVDRIIVRELLVQEARRRGLKTTEAEVAAAWDAERTRWGGEEKFQKSLELRNVTAEYLRERVAEDLLQRRLVQEVLAGPAPTDAQLLEYHTKNPGLFRAPGEPVLRCLYIDAAKHGGQQGAIRRYQAFRQRLDRGEPFAKLIEEFSDHPSAGAGGAMDGDFGAPLPFLERGRALVPGQFTDPPSEDDRGLYCYYRDRLTATLPFEQVREKVRASFLERQRKERIDGLVRDLRAAARIEFVPVATPAPAGR